MSLQIPQHLKAFPASVQDILLRCIVHSGVHADAAALDKRFVTGGTGKGAFANVPTEVDLEIAELGAGVRAVGVGACLRRGLVAVLLLLPAFW